MGISYNKIFCFGDGYASSHIWPEWPVIVQALYPDVEVRNFGAVGAGNEFIANALIKAHVQNNSDTLFLVQWAYPLRFDKLLVDKSWDQLIQSDPIYHFNRVTLDDHTWWISSASALPEIRHYHNYYVQRKQSILRSYNYIYSSSRMLADNAIFFSTPNLNFLNAEQKDSLSHIKWARHNEWNGMLEYSHDAKFSTIRQNQVQPSPPVHFSYVEEILLPCMPVQPQASRLENLRKLIFAQQWNAYDPDRDEIWINICHQL